MRERTGWIKVHRSMLDHPLMEQVPAAWLRVWIAILLTANWKPGAWWNGKEELQIQPGQFVTSIEKLSKIAHVTVKQTRGCLEYLQAAKMAAIDTASRYTHITVLNWATYQIDESCEGKLNGEVDGEVAAKSGQSEGKVGATIEESKNIKEHMSNSHELDSAPRLPRKPKPEIDAETRRWFEAEFWPIYPRHEAKAPALVAASKKATSPEKRAFLLERLTAQLPEYNRRKTESGQRVIPLAATWFNQGRADDELPVSAPVPGPRRGAATETDYPEYVSLGAGR
jgi:hypothetical protein